MLFDFNYSCRIGDTNDCEMRDDLKGVIFTLYEIISRDTQFTKVPHWEQDTGKVMAMEDWVQHETTHLDHPVADYRAVLRDWVNVRLEKKAITTYKEAPKHPNWPPLPTAPEKTYNVAVGGATQDHILPSQRVVSYQGKGKLRARYCLGSVHREQIKGRGASIGNGTARGRDKSYEQ
jgi:hypothetical protein